MKICTLAIKGYRQFQDTFFDFTDPATGEPASKICLIGKNGTGKSTILDLLSGLLMGFIANGLSPIQHTLHMKLKSGDRFVYLFKSGLWPHESLFFQATIDGESSWFDRLAGVVTPEERRKCLKELSQYLIEDEERTRLLEELRLKNSSSDLVVLSPPESPSNLYMGVRDVPNATLNGALQLGKDFPFYHIVSAATVNGFWLVLIHLIKSREEERARFENRPENLDKTKRQLVEEFDRLEPKILNGLSLLWNRILAQADLEFDEAGASNPVQLNDNLKAYIRRRSTGEQIGYSELSTGIRNFIFRIGHIYSLYFNREIKRGFLLVDEPENSLFPDFLFELMETYQEVVRDKNGDNNTQMFFATHNPIVAAQFEPYERIILDWDENGGVVARKGVAPAGDDPNDLLRQDFGLPYLMGKAGREKWEEYLRLKRQLRNSQDPEEKEEVLSRAADIATRYNF